MAKSAFITGGTGFLGRHIVEQLVAAQWNVTCFHRSSSDIKALATMPVQLRVGVLHDVESVAAAIPEGVDVVFHVAGNTSSWSKNNAEQTRDNVEGTRSVITASIQRSAKRLVQTSTWNVYGLGLGDNMALTETSPQLGNQSWMNYERSKWLAEQESLAAAKHGLEVVVLEPPHIMGKYDRVNWARLIVLAHQGRLPGVPPGSGQFAAADEVARAHLVAAIKGRSGERYLLPGVQATFLDVVKIIYKLAGRTDKLRVLPGFVLRLIGRAKVLAAALTGREPDITPEAAWMTIVNARIISTKAQEELGLQIRPLHEIVAESYRWLEQQGLLASNV